MGHEGQNKQGTNETGGASPLDLSIIIVNWNTRDMLLACLTSVYETVGRATFEVIVVDNGSTDDSVAAVKDRFPDVLIIENGENLGFAAANNIAFQTMSGSHAVLLNTDTVLTPHALDRLLAFMEKTPGAGMVGGQLLNLDASRQNSIANFPTLLSLLANETLLRLLFPKRFPSKRQTYSSPIPIESCIGACIMIRKAAMDTVGWLDERYFFFMEETDWALRMHRSGWDVFFVPDARIYHAQGQSVGAGARSRKLFYRSRYQYLKKWHPRTYPLYFMAIWGRLLVNAVSNMIGVTATAGCVPKMNARFALYRRLVAWHLKGCPDPLGFSEGDPHAD